MWPLATSNNQTYWQTLVLEADPLQGEERSRHMPTRSTFELSHGMQLCAGTDLLIAPLSFCQTLVNNTAYHNNLLYLVAVGHWKPGKKPFPWCHWPSTTHDLVRSAWLPGDNANVGTFPEPSSPCKWPGSETRRTMNHMYLTCIICSSLSKSPWVNTSSSL